MCGRFTQELTWRQSRDLLRLRGAGRPRNLPLRSNDALAQGFAACRLDENGNRAIAQLRWGLVPSSAKTARWVPALSTPGAETVHARPSFGDRFRSRRCSVISMERRGR